MSDWAWFNTALAAAMFFAAIYSIARMNGHSPNCIRVAILLIMVASLGQAIGPLINQWDSWLDTMLYVGIIVFLIRNRRYKRPEAL